MIEPDRMDLLSMKHLDRSEQRQRRRFRLKADLYRALEDSRAAAIERVIVSKVLEDSAGFVPRQTGGTWGGAFRAATGGGIRNRTRSAMSLSLWQRNSRS